MNSPTHMQRLKGFRYPRVIIAYAVWVHHRFGLSTADVEDLLAARSVIVSREAIRLWVKSLWSAFRTLHPPGSTATDRQVAS